MPTPQAIAQKLADTIKTIQPRYTVADGGKSLTILQGSRRQKIAIQSSQASDRAVQSR
ncbi:MAG: hypothetical protein AAF329_05620 [Cyanobacteria bacterium P01_A01_bin.17]